MFVGQYSKSSIDISENGYILIIYGPVAQLEQSNRLLIYGSQVRVLPGSPTFCGRGEIGKHKALKMPTASGSSPLARTTPHGEDII